MCLYCQEHYPLSDNICLCNHTQSGQPVVGERVSFLNGFCLNCRMVLMWHFNAHTMSQSPLSRNVFSGKQKLSLPPLSGWETLTGCDTTMKMGLGSYVAHATVSCKWAAIKFRMWCGATAPKSWSGFWLAAIEALRYFTGTHTQWHFYDMGRGFW